MKLLYECKKLANCYLPLYLVTGDFDIQTNTAFNNGKKVRWISKLSSWKRKVLAILCNCGPPWSRPQGTARVHGPVRSWHLRTARPRGPVLGADYRTGTAPFRGLHWSILELYWITAFFQRPFSELCWDYYLTYSELLFPPFGPTVLFKSIRIITLTHSNLWGISHIHSPFWRHAMKILVDTYHMEAFYYSEQHCHCYSWSLSSSLSRLATFVGLTLSWKSHCLFLETQLEWSCERMYIKEMTLKACYTVVLLDFTAWVGALGLCFRLHVRINVVKEGYLLQPLVEPFTGLFGFITQTKRAKSSCYQCVLKFQNAASRSEIH